MSIATRDSDTKANVKRKGFYVQTACCAAAVGTVGQPVRASEKPFPLPEDEHILRPRDGAEEVKLKRSSLFRSQLLYLADL